MRLCAPASVKNNIDKDYSTNTCIDLPHFIRKIQQDLGDLLERGQLCLPDSLSPRQRRPAPVDAIPFSAKTAFSHDTTLTFVFNDISRSAILAIRMLNGAAMIGLSALNRSVCITSRRTPHCACDALSATRDKPMPKSRSLAVLGSIWI